MAFNKKLLVVPALALGLLGTATVANAYHGWRDCDDRPYHGYHRYYGERGCDRYDDRDYRPYHRYHRGPCWYGDDRYDRDDRRYGPGPRMMRDYDRDDFRGDRSFPGPGPREMRGMPPRDRGPVFTPEQRAKYEQLADAFNEKAAPLRDQLFVKRAELRALENAPEPDVKAVSAKAQEILDVRHELGKLRNDFFNELEKAGLDKPAKPGKPGKPGPVPPVPPAPAK